MMQVFLICIPKKEGKASGIVCTAVYPDTFLVEPEVLEMIKAAIVSLMYSRN